MSEAIGYKILLFLASNPIAADIAEEFNIPLDLAYEIQSKHITLWQSMIKVRPKPERIGLLKSKYPLINGYVQDFKPKYRWCRGCKHKNCKYHRETR